MKRALSPSTNAPGLMASAAAIYAAVVMIVHVAHHQGVIDPQVIVSAVAAAAALYTRFVVTPVADPRDGNGKPLASVQFATGGVTTRPAPPAERGGYASSDRLPSELPPPPQNMIRREQSPPDPMGRPSQ